MTLMEYVFNMALNSCAPYCAKSFAPPQLPDKYAISAFFGGLNRSERTPALNRVEHEHDIIMFCVAVDIPDDLGISRDALNALIRKGHQTTDGKGNYCYIITPMLAWDFTPGQSTDGILADAVSWMSALHTVKLSYPDNGERKTVPLSVKNWWITGGRFPIGDEYGYYARHNK
jgi:hypothetical protein